MRHELSTDAFGKRLMYTEGQNLPARDGEDPSGSGGLTGRENAVNEGTMQIRRTMQRALPMAKTLSRLFPPPRERYKVHVAVVSFPLYLYLEQYEDPKRELFPEVLNLKQMIANFSMTKEASRLH